MSWCASLKISNSSCTAMVNFWISPRSPLIAVASLARSRLTAPTFGAGSCDCFDSCEGKPLNCFGMFDSGNLLGCEGVFGGLRGGGGASKLGKLSKSGSSMSDFFWFRSSSSTPMVAFWLSTYIRVSVKEALVKIFLYTIKSP